MGRIFRQDNALDFAFVRGIDHCVHQRHYESLRAAVDQFAHLGAHVFLVHGQYGRAFVIHPLLNAHNHRYLNERNGPVGTRQVGLFGIRKAIAITTGPHQRHRGFEARGGQQSH